MKGLLVNEAAGSSKHQQIKERSNAGGDAGDWG